MTSVSLMIRATIPLTVARYIAILRVYRACGAVLGGGIGCRVTSSVRAEYESSVPLLRILTHTHTHTTQTHTIRQLLSKPQYVCINSTNEEIFKSLYGQQINLNKSHTDQIVLPTSQHLPVLSH